MQILRSAVALLATATGSGVCFFMLQNAIGAASPWLGLLLMFYFMGLAMIAQPLFILRLPRTLRPVRAWEMDGPIYRRLAVHAFGKTLRNTPLRHLNSAVYLARRPRDLGQLYRQAGSAEAIHFWAVVLFAPYIAFVWHQGQTQVATLFLLIQLLVNVYPILHLRTLRGRLDRLSARPQANRPGTTANSGAYGASPK